LRALHPLAAGAHVDGVSRARDTLVRDWNLAYRRIAGGCNACCMVVVVVVVVVRACSCHARRRLGTAHSYRGSACIGRLFGLAAVVEAAVADA